MWSQLVNQVVITNAAVTTFAKLKKLEWSDSKCARLHVGKNKCYEYANIYVNDNKVKESDKEKYLGDYLTKYANPQKQSQIEIRKGMGFYQIWKQS